MNVMTASHDDQYRSGVGGVGRAGLCFFSRRFN